MKSICSALFLVIMLTCGGNEEIYQIIKVTKNTSCRFRKQDPNCDQHYNLLDTPNFIPGRPVVSNCEDQVQDQFKISLRDTLLYTSVCFDSRENNRIYNIIHPRLEEYWGISFNSKVYRTRVSEDEKNAYAFADSLVAIGKAYLTELSRKQDAEVLIAGTFAHEVGHLLQYKYMANTTYNYYDENDPKFLELQADFLGAVFLADNHDRGFNKSFYEALPFIYDSFNVGDCHYASSDHHGTPSQRKTAAIFGWMVGGYLKQRAINEKSVKTMNRFKNNYSQLVNVGLVDNLRTSSREDPLLSTDDEEILEKILNENISREELLNYFK